jgi:hypothetical protein
MNKYKQFSKSESFKKELYERKTCLSKKAYESIFEAQNNGAQLIYKCDICSKFHASAKMLKRIKKK